MRRGLDSRRFEEKIMNDTVIKRDITRLWNKEYKNYDNCYAHGIKSDNEKREWLRLLDSLIEKKPGEVLDVGAGTGFVSLLLAELGHSCKGLDLSENMLSLARKKAQDAGFDKVCFALGDAEDTQEPEEKYDVVINRHLVWTLPHPEKALADWRRVLKPGGKLIVLEGNWHYNRPLDRASVFLGKCLQSIQEQRNAFSKEDDSYDKLKKELPMMQSKNAKRLSQMVENAGFSITVIPLKAVDKAEKKAMPLVYRLLNPHKRIAVIGVKE